MKHIIEIKSLATPIGQEFLAAAYPGPGIYHNPSTLVWTLVYQVGVTLCCISLGISYQCPIPLFDIPEPEPIAVALNEGSGISASDLLKAIAISQNPLLAKELLK